MSWIQIKQIFHISEILIPMKTNDRNNNNICNRKVSLYTIH